MNLNNPMTSPTRRRGYLMLDLLVVMSLIVIVLSTSSIWLYKTMQYSSTVKQRDLHARNISRIGRQMRMDAFDANSISVQAKTLTLTTATSTKIEYLIDNNAIHRTMTGGKQTHHDDFTFAENANLIWSDDGDSDSVSLEIRRDFSAMSPSKTATSKRIDAVIRVRATAEDSKLSLIHI